ncbi:hypothetical protein HBI24_251130 [Parastagonospora nodorum]|nr:hypothetical protein HBI33_251230 [Parastagonospora nodorum]KAH5562800.1 hypothetical protein HBI24_251130 [Parastagonospora nodorum]KAH5702131.1 hypothetical protein HBI20_255780 [Parastagonospora nodorum]KAH5706832.1 hypothetical protein HBI18_252330 [Parastagonospora nodorum]KAH5721885.1 hypothetical protein HBI17_254150 [Parastagonospora nodorum]
MPRPPCGGPATEWLRPFYLIEDAVVLHGSAASLHIPDIEMEDVPDQFLSKLDHRTLSLEDEATLDGMSIPGHISYNGPRFKQQHPIPLLFPLKGQKLREITDPTRVHEHPGIAPTDSFTIATPLGFDHLDALSYTFSAEAARTVAQNVVEVAKGLYFSNTAGAEDRDIVEDPGSATEDMGRMRSVALIARALARSNSRVIASASLLEKANIL